MRIYLARSSRSEVQVRLGRRDTRVERGREGVCVRVAERLKREIEIESLRERERELQ